MSSEADQVVFAESVEEQNNVNLFESKKWTYITDASNGSFNGQIGFNLESLSNQNQWSDLSQAVIQFPVKLTIKSGPVASTTAPIPTVNSATIKSCFTNFIDSVQLVLGGQTVQSSQIFENVNATYKLLTEMTPSQYEKMRSTLGLGIDDFAPLSDTNMGLTDSLDNTAVITSAKGFDLASEAHNQGIKRRLQMFNNSSATSLGRSILGTNQSVLGKSQVQVAGAINTANADLFVLHALGTIRLADICDVASKLPLLKQLRGYLYLNYNSSETTLNAGAAGTAITSMTSTARYGRCCPASVINHDTLGFKMGATSSGTTITTAIFTADIDSTNSSTLTTATSIQRNAILHCPYYIATPQAEQALTMRKVIRYNERFVSTFTLDASGSANITLSSGITNPKRIILYPYATGAGSSGNSGFLSNPLLSCFDGVPNTTTPFASLKELQIYVGNQPMFQSPVNMDWQTFNNEVGQPPERGLLNQRMWNQLYKYYTCNIGRRMNSEDGASKSIQVSCSNATTLPLTVVAHIWYEKEITVNTASGEITQGM